ncbi:hypothetical protein KCP69_10710 [Salmonella enterica subsp. enterica]|nr:hypothetical protein KCP69_10710 [Salmonella enterica subsp. enterica]
MASVSSHRHSTPFIKMSSAPCRPQEPRRQMASTSSPARRFYGADGNPGNFS